MTNRPTITMGVTVLDTPDPAGLARFYAELLGAEITRTEDDWHEVRGEGTALAFQLAPDLIPTTWPEPQVPQQYHLDLVVADLDEGQEFAVSIGAEYVPLSDHPQDFRVFRDPSGHLFCLCRS